MIVEHDLSIVRARPRIVDGIVCELVCTYIVLENHAQLNSVRLAFTVTDAIAKTSYFTHVPVIHQQILSKRVN